MRRDDPYFDWLTMTVGMDRMQEDYYEMAKCLHEKIFVPKLEMDRNRGGDGLQLRVDFQNGHGPWGTSVNRGPCTFLEFLIGLARRMSFLMYGENCHHHTAFYFWKLIENLGLMKCTDGKWYDINGEFFVEDAVSRVNERLYSGDGRGGLFPLRKAEKDQRGVEIWYQMQAWLMENSGIGEL